MNKKRRNAIERMRIVVVPGAQNLEKKFGP